MAFLPESTSCGRNFQSSLIHSAGSVLITKTPELSYSAFCFMALILFSADHLLNHLMSKTGEERAPQKHLVGSKLTRALNHLRSLAAVLILKAENRKKLTGP